MKLILKEFCKYFNEISFLKKYAFIWKRQIKHGRKFFFLFNMSCFLIKFYSSTEVQGYVTTIWESVIWFQIHAKSTSSRVMNTLLPVLILNTDMLWGLTEKYGEWMYVSTSANHSPIPRIKYTPLSRMEYCSQIWAGNAQPLLSILDRI